MFLYKISLRLKRITSLVTAGATRGHSLHPLRSLGALSPSLAIYGNMGETRRSEHGPGRAPRGRGKHASVQSSLHPAVPSYPDTWGDAANALSSAIIKRLASHHEGLLWPPLTTPEPAVSTSLQDTRGKSSWITVSNEEGARQGVGEPGMEQYSPTEAKANSGHHRGPPFPP